LLEANPSSVESPSLEGAPPSFPRGRASNPFCVQRHGPGNVDYLFEGDEAQARLLRFLEENAWRAELVAPHGFGKSTLLATLMRRAEASGRRTLWFKVVSERPTLPLGWRWRWRGAGLLCVDSAELLAPRQFARVVAWARRRGVGVLATRHAPSGLLPTWRVESSRDVVARLARRLAGEDAGALAAVEEALEGFDGDARTWLGRLYEAHEAAL
jgi:hypothetical protein